MEKIDQVISSGPFVDQWESLLNYKIPQWYEDAKFGIFIHWGVYCVPAFGSEWYPRNMYLPTTREFAHHLAVYGPHAKFGYKDFIPMFKAEKFDPGAWADLFRRAGAKFVVPVAEHHDGFAMYDCGLSDWCAAKMGPKRDILGELAAATRKEGMVFGLSSHRAEHWWFFDGGMAFDSDVRDPRHAGLYGPANPRPANTHDTATPERPDAAFLDDWLARTCELVDKYQPQLVWFDWWIHHWAFKPYLAKFAAYLYNRGAEWGKGVAINYKYTAYPEGTAVFDIERGQLKGIRPLLWQNDTSVSKNSWGYITHHDYKTPVSIIHDLIDVVSKNGALLLNIGPRADGTIPEPEQEILREIGRWLSVNGEAIYGTRPWLTFGEGPTEVAEGAFTDTKRQAFTGKDVRFTRKGNALYAICLGWPEKEAVIQSLGCGRGLWLGGIDEVRMLGTAQPLQWSRSNSGLVVQMPEQRPCDHAYALRIALSNKD
ncbi:MAG: alpha-L-fucosidase [Candidatus Sumerlaeota bacterium]|nr:alpha-L-fucosidase [Candidatus Sumerlaeota bacterium]